MTKSAMTEQEKIFIRDAAQFLENSSLVMKLTKAVGAPIDSLQKRLPEKAQKFLSTTVESSLTAALKISIATIRSEHKPQQGWSLTAHRSKVAGWAHTAGVATTGALGGFFGLAALPVELPVSTGVMLRGISSVAAEWGFDIRDPEIQLQCVYVFTLGSPEKGAADEESSYLASRIAFSKIISEAAVYLGSFTAKELFSAVEKGTATIVARFLARVATYFEVAVSEKILASAIPVLGAIGGAAINAAFCDYYVNAARFHFGLMHLEKAHGREPVQKMFADAVRSAKKV